MATSLGSKLAGIEKLNLGPRWERCCRGTWGSQETVSMFSRAWFWYGFIIYVWSDVCHFYHFSVCFFYPLAFSLYLPLSSNMASWKTPKPHIFKNVRCFSQLQKTSICVEDFQPCFNFPHWMASSSPWGFPTFHQGPQRGPQRGPPFLNREKSHSTIWKKMLCDILENIDHLYLHKMVGYNSTFLTMTCAASTPKFDGSSVVSTFSMAFFRGIITNNLIFRQIQIKLLAISLTNPYYTSWCGWFANSCKLYYPG